MPIATEKATAAKIAKGVTIEGQIQQLGNSHRGDESFDEKLIPDILFRGLDGHAHADLSGSFRYRNQHDVHDADPPDQERNRGNTAQHEGKGMAGALLRLQ